MFIRKIAIINEQTGEMKAYDYVHKTFSVNNIYIVEVNKKYGIISENGKELSKIDYDYIDMRCRNGIFEVKRDGKYGFINDSGKEVCDIKYERVCDYTYGYAIVKLHQKYGFIDESGKEICDICYDEVSDFDESGKAVVRKGDKYGLIDQSGNVVCNFIYDEIGTFSNGLYRVKKDGFYSYIDTNYNRICDFKYKEADYIFNRDVDITKVGDGKKIGFINKKGEEIIPLIYNSVRFVHLKGMPVIVEKDSKWGVIAQDGKVIARCKYDYIDLFENGYSHGIYLKNGKVIEEWLDMEGNIYDKKPN